MWLLRSAALLFTSSQLGPNGQRESDVVTEECCSVVYLLSVGAKRSERVGCGY